MLLWEKEHFLKNYTLGPETQTFGGGGGEPKLGIMYLVPTILQERNICWINLKKIGKNANNIVKIRIHYVYNLIFLVNSLIGFERSLNTCSPGGQELRSFHSLGSGSYLIFRWSHLNSLLFQWKFWNIWLKKAWSCFIIN